MPSPWLPFETFSTMSHFAVQLRYVLVRQSMHYISVCVENMPTSTDTTLSCPKTGRHSRHTALNASLKRALQSAGIFFTLEPSGLSLIDGKRPDGLTLSPWARGKCLLWDATCVCKVALSNLAASSTTAGSAATEAEDRKNTTYKELFDSYLFEPLGFETIGGWEVQALELIRATGRKILNSTGETRSTEYLKQRLYIDNQRGNAVCVLNSLSRTERV